MRAGRQRRRDPAAGEVEAWRRARHDAPAPSIDRGRLGFPNGWRAAEDAVANILPTRARQSYQAVDGMPHGRFVDIVDVAGDFHEVKSGYVTLRSRISRQIEKDALLRQQQSIDVTWHFVASNRSGSLGADPRVLDLLDEAGISYVIHLP